MRRFRPKLIGLRRDQRGASAVEFALVVPVFILLVLGIIDFGLGIWTYNNLAEAVREGARYAIVRGDGADTLGEVGPAAESTTCALVSPATPVAAVVCDFAMPLDPSKITVTVNWNCGVGGDPDACGNDFNRVGERIKVSATYQFSPFISTLIPVTMNLKSTARMHILCCS